MSEQIEALKADINRNLKKCGVLLVSEIRKNLNTAQPYVRRGAYFRGLEPSAPGEFPKKLSGQLFKSVAYTVDEQNMVLTVGTNIRYGKFLEFGTRFMRPRPWLLRTFNDNQGKINDIFKEVK